MKLTVKEFLKKFNQVFELTDTIEQPTKFIDAKVPDQSLLVESEGTDFTIGNVLIVVHTDATTTNASEGNYVLEDGRTLVVGSGGVITDIQDPSNASKETKENKDVKETKETKEVKENKDTKEVENLKKELSELKDSFNELKKGFEGFSKIQNNFKTLLTELGAKPSEDPIIEDDPTSIDIVEYEYKPRARASNNFNKLKQNPRGK